MTSEKRAAEKFHTGDHSDLRSAYDWLKQIFNQSEALPRSGLWHVISTEFLRCSFLRCHFAGKPSVASARNVSCFLRLPLGPESRNAPRPHRWGQGALHRDFGPNGCKGDYLYTKWLVFISLFLTYFFFFFYILFVFFFHAIELNSQVLQVRRIFLILCSPGNSCLHYIVTIDNSKCPFFGPLGLGQTSNCSWDESNSNLGQPNLS